MRDSNNSLFTQYIHNVIEKISTEINEKFWKIDFHDQVRIKNTLGIEMNDVFPVCQKLFQIINVIQKLFEKSILVETEDTGEPHQFFENLV